MADHCMFCFLHAATPLSFLVICPPCPPYPWPTPIYLSSFIRTQ
jgi:hypothetical protein